jgi:hypothetical protein
MIVERLGLQCGLAGESALCTTFALLVGALAGSFIAFREAEGRGQVSSWLTAATVATLAASLGCVRLGIMGVASVVLGIGVGCAAMSISRRIAGQHPGAHG